MVRVHMPSSKGLGSLAQNLDSQTNRYDTSVAWIIPGNVSLCFDEDVLVIR